MTSLIARRATAADAEAAVGVLRRAIIESCGPDHQNDPPTLECWLHNKTPGHFRDWLDNPDNFIVVATIGSDVVGVGAVRANGQLDLCYVEPTRQHRGIGRTIMNALETHAQTRGLDRVQVFSTTTARAFYERHGYIFTGIETESFGITHDYHYTKELRASAPAGEHRT
jgi:GNAT superfamily N-acetyltransferase